MVPHNPLSPVSTAACIQLAAAVPNFAIQEYPLGEDSVPKNRIVKSTLTLKDGYLTVPEGPGIGIELNESVMNDYPYKPRLYVTKLREDGAVADQ